MLVAGPQSYLITSGASLIYPRLLREGRHHLPKTFLSGQSSSHHHHLLAAREEYRNSEAAICSSNAVWMCRRRKKAMFQLVYSEHERRWVGLGCLAGYLRSPSCPSSSIRPEEICAYTGCPTSNLGHLRGPISAEITILTELGKPGRVRSTLVFVLLNLASGHQSFNQGIE